jgi:hypothetical protein
LNGNEKLVYRTNDFPGFGFLLKKTVYEKYMKNNFQNCCKNRVWHNWNIEKGLYSLIPDVSRSYRRPYNGINSDRSFLDNLLNRQRKTNLLPFPEINNLDSLTGKENYEKSLKNDLIKAVEIKNTSAACNDNGEMIHQKEKG